MDIGKAFTFMKEDSDWLMKSGIGALIMLSSYFVGFTAIILAGYQVAVARQVMSGKDSSLPAWDDFGEILIDSIKITLVRFVYYLPGIFLFCGGMTVFMIPLMRMGEASGEQFWAMFTLPFFALICLSTIYMIIVSIFSPILTIQYIKTNDIMACFRFHEIFTMVKDHFGDILLIVASLIGAGIVGAMITGISAFTIVGPFILGILLPVWLHMANGHLTGQLGRKMGKVADFFEPEYMK